MDDVPHPSGAMYAMRFPIREGDLKSATLLCEAHAREHCPSDMLYGFRAGAGWVEWYAPVESEPRVITRVLSDGISTKDGCA